jgi:hypothetical protein
MDDLETGRQPGPNHITTIASITTPLEGVRAIAHLASSAIDPANMSECPCPGTACPFASLGFLTPPLDSVVSRTAGCNHANVC